MLRGILFFGMFVCVLGARAQDFFYRIPFSKLAITSGSLPEPKVIDERMDEIKLWARLDAPGEILLRRDQQVYNANGGKMTLEVFYMLIRTPRQDPLKGCLFWPDPENGTLLHQLNFTTPQTSSTAANRHEFYLARVDEIERLGSDSAGSAWFRHELEKARAEAGLPTEEEQTRPVFMRDPQFSRTDSEMDRTFELFSGGRAISENLQLDRALGVLGAGAETVPIDSIEGIKVQPMDWSKLTAGLQPQPDRLAAYIPADQHAIFFPSFKAMTDVLDEADQEGTPVMHMVETRAEDARTRARYQRQLCLSTDALSRLIGPKVISGVAFTGSDPYLRAGSDVAILFAAVDARVLLPLLAARQEQGRQGEPAAQAVTGQVDGVAWQGVRSPDRAICSYLAAMDDVVVVTNSPRQLERIVAAMKKKAPALGEQGEYIFFRDRYKPGENGENALLVLSDATIRRWCGARWRIGNSRRTRVASVLADLQARHLDELARGKIPPPEALPGAGEINWTATGPVSSIYGSLDFMTPITELALDKATTTETRAYTRFRDNYQNEWRQYFDPIAVRLSIEPARLGADLTVMPLVLSSDFRHFAQAALGTVIASGAGDPHPEALAHIALAINKDSDPLRELGQNMSQMRGPAEKAVPNPLGWLGTCIAVYADEDPFWKQLLGAQNREMFFEKNYPRLPLGISVEVGDGLKLALFLTTLRGMVEQTAPGLTRWSTEEYKGHPYTRISVAGPGAQANAATTDTSKLSIFYASTPAALVISPNKALVERALDRLTSATQPAAGSPWIGKQLALKARKEALEMLQDLGRESYQETMQKRAWSNLPILNEWHRRYPDRNPVEFHERFWHTRLSAPSGGDYTWNEQWQTMESTLYGHPGQPRRGPAMPDTLRRLTAVNLGVTFENDGLRGRAEVQRIGQ